MPFGEFVTRFFGALWIILWMGYALLLWISAIRHVVKGSWIDALFPIFGASVLTAALLAAKAVQYLGR